MWGNQPKWPGNKWRCLCKIWLLSYPFVQNTPLATVNVIVQASWLSRGWIFLCKQTTWTHVLYVGSGIYLNFSRQSLWDSAGFKTSVHPKCVKPAKDVDFPWFIAFKTVYIFSASGLLKQCRSAKCTCMHPFFCEMKAVTYRHDANQ